MTARQAERRQSQWTVFELNSGISCTFCPGGPDQNSNPPKCIMEIDLGNAALNLMAAAPDGGPPQVNAVGPIPMRIQDLPLTCSYLGIPFSANAAVNGNSACPPSPQTFANVSVQALLAVNDTTPIDALRVGCSALTSITVDVDAGDLSNAMQFCGGPVALLDALKSIFISAFAPVIQQGVVQAIDGQVCASP